MVKFKVGSDGGLPPGSNLQSQTSKLAAQHKVQNKTAGKTVKTAHVQAPIDLSEVSEGERIPTSGLGKQVKLGQQQLAEKYYATQGGEPAFLNLLSGATESEGAPEHIVRRHAKQLAKDLGLSQEKATSLVNDLALVLA